MKTIKALFGRYWKQLAGAGAVYLALEVGALVFVAIWGMSKVVT